MLKRLENWLIEKTALGTGSFSLWFELTMLAELIAICLIVAIFSINTSYQMWGWVKSEDTINKKLDVMSKDVDTKFEKINKTLDKNTEWLKENSHV